MPAIECPHDVADCETAGGEIVYVERVDPDGDGDAHFVLLSGDSITAPGLSVIDVRTDLRPDPLPGPGDLLAAAGPVYEGSYGQSQIQAEVIAVTRRRVTADPAAGDSRDPTGPDAKRRIRSAGI